MNVDIKRPFPQPGLESLLDRVEQALSDDLLPAEIFNNEEIFRAEIERIFMKSWVFVAHESEIPKAGDYVLRRIGLDPVIVTRDDKGDIHVISNHCRHRGTEVCQTDHGNAKFFKCPYHGWAYRNNGDWAGAPHLAEAYGQRLDPKKWGLLRAHGVGAHQGFIFATLNPNAPDLKTYLGAAAWMLDAIVGLHPDGMRVVGMPDRYRVRANWKTAAENFAGDVYHVDYLHWSTEQINVSQGLHGTCEFARSYELGNGHNFAGHEWTKAIHPGFVLWGYPSEITEKFDLSRLDDAQRLMVTHKPPTVGNIFPNLSYIRFATPTGQGEPMSVVTSFRQWQPVAPGVLEVWSWQFAWRFTSDEDAQRSAQIGQYVFGSGGIFEQDDTMAWEGVPRAGSSTWLRQEGLNFNFQQGRDSKIDQSPDPTWTGPGVHRTTGYGEHRQLAFYRHWLSVMRQDSPANVTMEQRI